MLATAIEAHPYRVLPGGWASDIENLRVKEAEKFFATYYVPATSPSQSSATSIPRR